MSKNLTFAQPKLVLVVLGLLLAPGLALASTYVFKMSGNREIRYGFGAAPGRNSDRIEYFVDGKLDSQVGLKQVTAVHVDPGASASSLSSIPRGVTRILTDPASTVILEAGQEYSVRSGKVTESSFLRVFVPSAQRKPGFNSEAFVPVHINLKLSNLPANFLWRSTDFDEALVDLRFQSPVAKLGSPEFEAASNENGGANASAKFIVPNEFENYSQMRNLEPGPGVVISVGTLRAFNLAAVLRRSGLVALDYSPEVINFDKTLASLISSYNRTEMLAIMLGTEASQLGDASREKILSAVDMALQRNLPPDAHDPRLSAFYNYLPHPKPGSQTQQSIWRAWLLSLRQYALDEAKWSGTFFRDEMTYQHLHKLISEARFVAVIGSLSGDKAMPAVANLLEKQNLKVSEIDVSNALEHVAGFEGEAGLKRFLWNLSGLPTNSETHVLYTIDQNKFKSNSPAANSISTKWEYKIANLAMMKSISLNPASWNPNAPSSMATAIFSCSAVLEKFP